MQHGKQRNLVDLYEIRYLISYLFLYPRGKNLLKMSVLYIRRGMLYVENTRYRRKEHYNRYIVLMLFVEHELSINHIDYCRILIEFI